MKKWLWLIVLLALGGLGFAGFQWWKQKGNATVYRQAAIEKGDIRKEVTASGTLNPRLVVQVGTQVSGSIAKVFVDFNDKVRKGQLLAMLDTTFLRAAVEDAKAQQGRAEAQKLLANKQAERTKQLFEKGLSSQADWDQSQADVATANANWVAARAQLDRARINMRYASITAPIDGVVISRQVDAGQTVAASFNTPTLFAIADALDSMEVQANVDEADIGQVWKDQSATFTVDAYPGKQFTAQVVQVRLQPITVQNVVQYTVILRVRNDNGKLLPGMTANVTLLVAEKTGILKVPTAALAYKPPRPQTGKKKYPEGQMPGGHRADKARNDSAGTVFIVRDGKPMRIPVSTGLSDGGFTEIHPRDENALAPGDSIIIGSSGGPPTGAGNARKLGAPDGPGANRGLRRL